jgi:uncharacterized protein
MLLDPRPSRKGRPHRLARWLHLYLSVFSLGALLFFSVTGFTLNHADWFYADEQSTRELSGSLNAEWVRPDPFDAGSPVAKLEVVEALRATHGLRGAVANFDIDPALCVVVFAAPGYGASAFIERETGSYTLTETFQGVVAVLNDLHKGRDSGPVWSVVIDLSAILCTLAALTGLWLLLYIKRRVKTGLIMTLVGVAVLYAFWQFWVP